MQKGGFSGVGRVAESQRNVTTEAIVGLLFGSSCTHKSPTWMHFIASSALHDSDNDGSIKSVPFSSFHNRQAYNISR
ncbi:hypothetical protein, partial [Klebsiella oxytoca]|uniref:hypothetical protein n=1 Tax=Klebsiella oxytoca TaxID=571 RepID=UPI003F813A46